MKREIDKTTLIIRFACGFIFGVFGGGMALFRIFHSHLEANMLIILCLMTGIISGFLAARYGDDFWYSLRDW